MCSRLDCSKVENCPVVSLFLDTVDVSPSRLGGGDVPFSFLSALSSKACISEDGGAIMTMDLVTI